MPSSPRARVTHRHVTTTQSHRYPGLIVLSCHRPGIPISTLRGISQFPPHLSLLSGLYNKELLEDWVSGLSGDPGC